MTIQRAVLLIADIGGYTRFMKEHRFALAHAQDAVARLLEAVIDGSRPLKLAKLEGDAAFFWAPIQDEPQSWVGTTVANIRAAFLRRRQDMTVNQLCDCKGCVEVATLTLKFVAHVGEVALQRVKRNTELAGVDVILVHRMLKNDVPVREYVLMTEPVVRDLDPAVRAFARELEHDFEGLGRTRTYYVDIVEIEADLPPPLQRPYWRRFLERVALVFRSLPYWLGLAKPCAEFKNLEDHTAGPG